LENEFQTALQVLGGGQAGGGSVYAITHAGFLLTYPFAQVAMDETHQLLDSKELRYVLPKSSHSNLAMSLLVSP
jgi:hypothetical protein